MQFLLKTNADETAWESATQDDKTRRMTAHHDFAKKVPEMGGTLLDGEALEDFPDASTVRDGAITGGPFLECEVSLGGYHLIDVPSREVALETARHCRDSKSGVGIRGVRDTANL